jgi:hypothetical protein
MMLSQVLADALREQATAVLRRIEAIAGSGYASAAEALADALTRDHRMQAQQVAIRIEAGAALAEMRRSVRHGAFEDEVRRATGLHPRTARNWRLLAEFAASEPTYLPLILECRTVTAALALVRQTQGRRSAPTPPPSIMDVCQDIFQLDARSASALARLVTAQADLAVAQRVAEASLSFDDLRRLRAGLERVTGAAGVGAPEDLRAMVDALGGAIQRASPVPEGNGTARRPAHRADDVSRVSISLFAESVDGGTARDGSTALVAAARHSASLVECVARGAPTFSHEPAEVLVGGYVAGNRAGRLTAALVTPFVAIFAVIPLDRSSQGVPLALVGSCGLIWGQHNGDAGILALGLPTSANHTTLEQLGASIRLVQDPSSDAQCRQLIDAALAGGGDGADIAAALLARDWRGHPLVQSLRCRSIRERWGGRVPPAPTPRSITPLGGSRSRR